MNSNGFFVYGRPVPKKEEEKKSGAAEVSAQEQEAPPVAQVNESVIKASYFLWFHQKMYSTN